MRLSALLSALPAERAPLRLERAAADDDPVIRGLSYDSRAVAPGDLFFALRGAQADGHAYLEQALELGAAALVVEEIPPALDLRGRPAVLVPDSRRALAPISTRFPPTHRQRFTGSCDAASRRTRRSVFVTSPRACSNSKTAWRHNRRHPRPQTRHRVRFRSGSNRSRSR